MDEQAIQNLGSLEGYLGNQQYTTAQVPMQGEQVVRDERLGPVTAPGPYDYAPQGVAPQPQPGVSQAQFDAVVEYAQRMEQTATIAAQQAIMQEEQRFLAQLDYYVEMGQMTDAQRDVQIVLRHNQQLEQSNQTMSQRIQAEADAVEEREQMDAKVRVSYREAMDHGINWFNNDVRATILQAEDLEDMRAKLRVLQMYPGAVLTPNQAQQSQAQVAAGAFAAANGRGNGSPPAQVQKKSGELGKYIQSKGGYQSRFVE
jgi:hypothetical protein